MNEHSTELLALAQALIGSRKVRWRSGPRGETFLARLCDGEVFIKRFTPNGSRYPEFLFGATDIQEGVIGELTADVGMDTKYAVLRNLFQSIRDSLPDAKATLAEFMAALARAS